MNMRTCISTRTHTRTYTLINEQEHCDFHVPLIKIEMQHDNNFVLFGKLNYEQLCRYAIYAFSLIFTRGVCVCVGGGWWQW